MERPWSVQVEFVEGCNRLCSFCGLTGLDRSKHPLFMETHTAKMTAQGIALLNPTARIEFAMHGEPTLHPQFLSFIQMFRLLLPNAQMQVTTNGRTALGKMQTMFRLMFIAGIDFIILDTYRPEREKLQAEAKTLKGIQVKDFYSDLAPKGFSPWGNHHRKVRNLVIIMDDLGVRTGEVKSRVILNHAGNSKGQPVPSEPLKKNCTNPFREVSINYNGDVCVCCMDWKHQYVCGNVNDEALHRIWEGPRFELARKFLSNKSREFSPCRLCNKGEGVRSGLLPKYPKLTKEDRKRMGAI